MSKLIDVHFHLDFYKNHKAVYNRINQLEQYTLCMTNSSGVYLSCKNLYPETKYLKFALGFHPLEASLKDKDFSDLFPKDRWCRRKDDWTLEYHEQVQRELCKMNTENALRIMMAKRGKILDYDADRSSSYSQNVMSSGISADSPLTAYVLIWCAKELEKQGIGNRFVVPSIGKYGAGGLHWEL